MVWLPTVPIRQEILLKTTNPPIVTLVKATSAEVDLGGLFVQVVKSKPKNIWQLIASSLVVAFKTLAYLWSGEYWDDKIGITIFICFTLCQQPVSPLPKMDSRGSGAFPWGDMSLDLIGHLTKLFNT